MADTMTKVLDIQVKYKEAVDSMMKYALAVDEAKKSMANLAEQYKKKQLTDAQYQKQVQATKVVLQQEQENLRKVGKEIQNNLRTEQQQVGSLASLRAQLSNATKQYDELSRAERNAAKGQDLMNHINALTKELKDAEMETQRFYRNVGNYPQAMGQLGGAMSGIISTIPGLGALGATFQGISSSLGSMMKGVTSAAGGLGIFGAAVAGTTAAIGAVSAAFADGAATAKDYNKAVSVLTAIRGKEFVSDVKMLTDQARELGAKTRYTATEVVQLQTELAKLGFEDTEIKNMTEATLNLATATGTDLASAAKLAGATLRMFGADSSHTAEFMDKIASATTKSALDFSYLETAMSTVGPVANAFNFKIEDVLALLGKLADAGFDASSAATATRNILLNLADSNGALAQQLGGSVHNLDELADGLAKLRDRNVNLAESLALTDKRSVSAFNTFLQTAEGVKKLKNDLNDAQGETEKMAHTMADNLEGDLATLSSAWQDVTLSISGMQEPLRSIVKGLTDVVRAFGSTYTKVKSQLEDLYNRSIGFRAVIQTVVVGLDVIVDATKSAFRIVGDVVVGFGKALKGAFTLDWDVFAAGMEQWTSAVTKNTRQAFEEMGNDLSEGFRKAINDSVKSGADAAEEAIEDVTGEKPSAPKKGNGSGAGIVSDKEKNKQAAATKARLKADMEARATYEKSLVELIRDSNEKQKALLQQQANKEIEQLKFKLQTEKGLTEKGRQDIENAIKNREQKLSNDLRDLDLKITAESIKKRQESIQLELDAVKKGTEQEYDLLLKQNDIKRQAELAAAEQSITDKEELEQRKLLITQKYAALTESLAIERENTIAEREKQAMTNRFTEQMMEAENNSLTQAQLEMEYKKNLLDSLHQLENESDEAFKARQLQAEQDYIEAKRKLSNTEVEIEQAKYEMYGAISGGMKQIFDAMGKDNKAFAKASKVLALAEIAINTGKAIAAGTAQAMSVPYPANLVAIATTITTVMANIASAISTVKSAKFAKGVVNLQGGGSATSDSIPARLSRGESVMTANATKMFGGLLTVMNKVATQPSYTLPTSYMQTNPMQTEADTESATVSFSAAVENIHPQVSVVEINEAANRVSVLETIDNY